MWGMGWEGIQGRWEARPPNSASVVACDSVCVKGGGDHTKRLRQSPATQTDHPHTLTRARAHTHTHDHVHSTPTWSPHSLLLTHSLPYTQHPDLVTPYTNFFNLSLDIRVTHVMVQHQVSLSVCLSVCLWLVARTQRVLACWRVSV